MVKVLLVLHAGTYDNPLWPQEVKKFAEATCRRPAVAAANVSKEGPPAAVHAAVHAAAAATSVNLFSFDGDDLCGKARGKRAGKRAWSDFGRLPKT